MNAFEIVHSRLKQLQEETMSGYYPFQAEFDPTMLSRDEILNKAIEETEKVYDLLTKHLVLYCSISLPIKVGRLLNALKSVREGGSLADSFTQEEFEEIVDEIERMPYTKAYIRESFQTSVANMITLVKALY